MTGQTETISRRAMLRRAAVTGGGLAWGIPLVQTLGSASAYAVVSPPPIREILRGTRDTVEEVPHEILPGTPTTAPTPEPIVTNEAAPFTDPVVDTPPVAPPVVEKPAPTEPPPPEPTVSTTP